MRKGFLAMLFVVVLLPTLLFAGIGDKVKMDIAPVVTTVIALLLSGGLVSNIRKVRKLRKAIKEIREAAQAIKSRQSGAIIDRESEEAMAAVMDLLSEWDKEDLDKLKSVVKKV